MQAEAKLAQKPSLTIRRRFNASPSKLYAAWTDPKQIAQWMGPEGIDAIGSEADPRVGGRYRFVMRGTDGEEHDVSGTYREVVPNEKLVFTWAWRTTPERQSLVTVTFKPDDGGSLMTLTHEQFFDEAARDRHNAGWSTCFNKLERFLSQ
jgi:uncharacterized protein YndB with AHSA1/START domain